MSGPPPGRKIIVPKSKINNPRALPTLTAAPGPSGSTTHFSFASPGSSPPVAALGSYGETKVTATPAVGGGGGIFGTRATGARSMFATAGKNPSVRAGAAGRFGASPLLPSGPASSSSSSPFSSPLSEVPKTSISGPGGAPEAAAASRALFRKPFGAPPVYNPSFSPSYPAAAAQVPPKLAVGLPDKSPPVNRFGAPAVYNPFTAAAATAAAAASAPAVGHFNTPSPSAAYNPFATPTITTATGAAYNPFVAPTITTAAAAAPAPAPAPGPTDISALLRRIKKHIPPTAQSAPPPNLFNPPAANPFNMASAPPTPPLTYQPLIAPVTPNTTNTTPDMATDFANLAAIMRELQKPLPPAQPAQPAPPAPPAFLAQTTTTDTTTPAGLPQGYGSVNIAATTSMTPAGWPPGFRVANVVSTGSGGSTLFGQAQNAAPAFSAGPGSSSLFGQAVPTPTPTPTPAPAPAPTPGGVFSSVLPTEAAATTGFSFGNVPVLPQADAIVSPTDTRAPYDPASLFQTAAMKPTAAPATSAPPLFPAVPAVPAVPPIPPIPHSTTTTTTNTPTNQPISAPTTTTNTFPPLPPLPTYLTPTTSLSDATTHWTATLEAHIQTFMSHGALLRNCDATILTVRDTINDLTLATSSAEAESATHNRALDRLAADQRRMEEVLDWYEAFIGAQERAPEPVDAEREGMLGGFLGASERVEEMVKGAEEMVSVLNEAGGRVRGVGGPLAAVVTILNDHLATLLWVDGQTAMLNGKVTEAKEAARSVPDLEGDAQFRSAAWLPWDE